MITNYHGHTVHCKHGVGTTREHIEAAINFGLQEVAITEHVPIKNKRLSRIDYEDFESFITELLMLKEEYADRIKVLTGLECEYVEEVIDDHLELKEKYGIDFLVLGHHFSNLSQPGHYYFETRSDEMVEEYISQAIKGVESGLFAIFAHPDVFLNKMDLQPNHIELCKQLLAACQKQDIVIEINGNGFRNNKGYPNRKFWQLVKEYDLRVVINADSHAPEEIYDHGVRGAYAFAEELQIEITERLDFN